MMQRRAKCASEEGGIRGDQAKGTGEGRNDEEKKRSRLLPLSATGTSRKRRFAVNNETEERLDGRAEEISKTNYL